MVKVCRYRNCKSTTYHKDKPYMENVTFIPFPNPTKHREKCLIWIDSCKRPHFTSLDDLSKWCYVCSKHFVGGRGPTKEHPNPIPATETEELVRKIDARLRRTKNPRNGGKVNGRLKQTQNNGLEINEHDVNSGETEDLNAEPTDFFNLTISTIPGFDCARNTNFTLDDSRISNDEFEALDTHNEAFEPLKSLHRDLSGLKDWAICLKDDALQFHILCERAATSVKAVLVDLDLKTHIRVLNNELPAAHSMWKLVPQSVTNSGELLNTLNLVKSWVVCNGINNDALVKWFKNLISPVEEAVFVFKTESLHSRNCDLLYSSTQIKCDRCIESEKMLQRSLEKERLCRLCRSRPMTQQQMMKKLLVQRSKLFVLERRMQMVCRNIKKLGMGGRIGEIFEDESFEWRN